MKKLLGGSELVPLETTTSLAPAATVPSTITEEIYPALKIGSIVGYNPFPFTNPELYDFYKVTMKVKSGNNNAIITLTNTDNPPIVKTLSVDLSKPPSDYFTEPVIKNLREKDRVAVLEFDNSLYYFCSLSKYAGYDMVHLSYLENCIFTDNFYGSPSDPVSKYFSQVERNGQIIYQKT